MRDLLEDRISDKDVEQIANDVAKEVLHDLKKKDRPSAIYLYGVKNEYLVKVMIEVGLRLKKYEENSGEDLNIQVFIGQSEKDYSVDVGKLLESIPSKVS